MTPQRNEMIAYRIQQEDPMQITISVAARRLASGINDPGTIEVSVDPASLTKEARRILLVIGDGAECERQASRAREDAGIEAYLADPSARPRTIDSAPIAWIEIGGEIGGQKIGSDHPQWPLLLAETERRLAADDAAAHEEEWAWIAAHGSPRLQRLRAERIEYEAVYRDERLALERPGWVWERKVQGEAAEPRNVPESAFAVLDAARAVDPEAQLVYWTVACPYYAGYAARARFLGHEIVLGVPEAYH